MRLIILEVLVFLGHMAQPACQMSQTNVVAICTVNYSSPERVDRIVERVSKLEAQESATSAATIHRVVAVETACEQIRSRLEKLHANNSEELDNRAEAFYATRYKELKDANDRFSDSVDKWLTIIGWVVGLVSVIVALTSLILGCIVPAFKFHKRTKEVEAMAERIRVLERKCIADRSSYRVEMRDQARWILSMVVQDIDTAPRVTPADLQRLTHLLSCFLLQFYHLIDSCVLVDEEVALKAEVRHFASFISRWLSNDDPNSSNALKSAMLGVKKQICPDRTKYEELLGEDSEEVDLLGSLFKRMDVWA